LKEVEDKVNGIPISPPRVMLPFEYNLNRVIDLVDLKSYQTLSTNLTELTRQNWRVKNSEKEITSTQILGRVIYDTQNIEAIKVPSSMLNGTYNLVIFSSKLSGNSYVRVCDEDKLIKVILGSG
jgi:hypothetical protein